jgi:membrane-bound lytic murein transglycosylase B
MPITLYSVYAADVDGDGDLDVLSASSTMMTQIAWYENDGRQNFTSNVITTSAAWLRSVYAADVDGDGDMDVLSASVLDNKIAWYENDGTAALQ